MFTVAHASSGSSISSSLRRLSLVMPGQKLPASTPHSRRPSRIRPVDTVSFPVTSISQMYSFDHASSKNTSNSPAAASARRSSFAPSLGAPPEASVSSVH